jgi:EAL domain-containing protein (putative c-di-GMP-specific phosphodiesterase class I)
MDPSYKFDRLAAYLQRLNAHTPGADLWAQPDGSVWGAAHGVWIGSAFEPVHALGDGRLVAQRALTRLAQPEAIASAATTGAAGEPTPSSLFARALGADELVALDRRCRTVHTLNFFAGPGAHAPCDLILRVHDRLLTAVAENHGQAFKRVLDSLHLPVARVVIELPPQSAVEPGRLANVIASYRHYGFRVAASPRDADEADALLARVRCDLVRIDASLWAAFAGGRPGEPPSGAQWAGWIDGLRAQGARVLLAGVDDAAALALARTLAVDLVQGAAVDAAALAGEGGAPNTIASSSSAPNRSIRMSFT